MRFGPEHKTYGDVRPTRIPVSDSGAAHLDGAGAGLRGPIAPRARVFGLLGGRRNFKPSHSRFRAFVFHAERRIRADSGGDVSFVGEIAAVSPGERIAGHGSWAHHGV